jgi:Lipocalin-like domain
MSYREEIMNRRSILNIFAMTAFGLALVSSSAVAQQKSLKEQLVGIWTLIAADATTTNGKLLGANPRGILVLDAGGRYALINAKRDRPKITGGRLEASPEEFKAAAQGLVAQFGTWSVNESDKTLARRVEGALLPNAEGMEQKTSVSVAEDELKLGNAVYRRAK